METTSPPQPPPGEPPAPEPAPDDLAAPTEAPEGTPRASFLRRFFLMEEDFAQAKLRGFSEKDPGFPEFREACSLRETAVKLISAQTPLDLSDGASSAVLLLREAAFWALAAHAARGGAPASEEESALALWTRERTREGGELAELPQERGELIEKALSPRPRNAHLPASYLHAEVSELRAGVEALLAPLEAEVSRIQGLRVQRTMRWVAVFGGLLLALGGGLRAAQQAARGPNLALHKPVTSSPQSAGYSAQSITDGETGILGSHSENEFQPWVQIDLGAPTQIRRVVVYNRSDFGEDRAVPLRIETSVDGKTFTQVARNDNPFLVWDAKFHPTTARYVRLKCEKKTYLHLNEVTVHNR